MQLFLLSMMAASVCTGYLSDRVRRKAATIWLFSVAASLVTLGCIYVTKIGDMLLYSVPLGIVSGAGIPLIGAFFSDRTSPEDRGRIIGLPIGLSFILAFAYYAGIPYMSLSAKTELVLVGVLCLPSLATVLFRPAEESVDKADRKRVATPKTRQVVLYAFIVFLFYWVAGILLSIFVPSIRDHVSETTFYLAWSVPFLVGALVAGYMYDSMGRSFPAIIGLATTGVSLAIFGVYGLNSSWVFLTLLSVGFSFSIVFSFLVWADLAPSGRRGLFFGCGMGLTCLAMLLGLVSAGTIFGSVSASYIKSYIMYSAVALFLCIPMLIMAEDLLPKELIEKRRFQEYLEHARKRYINPR
jgi:MFS family permease